jgi:hypothetical protein
MDASVSVKTGTVEFDESRYPSRGASVSEDSVQTLAQMRERAMYHPRTEIRYSRPGWLSLGEALQCLLQGGRLGGGE